MKNVNEIFELLNNEEHIEISYISDPENGDYGDSFSDYRIIYCSDDAEEAITKFFELSGLHRPEFGPADDVQGIPPEYIDCIRETECALDPISHYGLEKGERWDLGFRVNSNRSLGEFMEYCREHDREVFDSAIESAKQRLQNWEPDPDWDETEDDQPSPYLNPMKWPEFVRRTVMIEMIERMANAVRQLQQL